MKAYQHHDPIADKGKAVPHPKVPTQYTYRGRRFGGVHFAVNRDEVLTRRKASVKVHKGRALHTMSVIGTLCAILGIRRKGGRR
jgi:hypothetical protein